MKDYKAIADSVLRRRDEYLEKKKKKRVILIRRASIALSCCLVILAGFGIWRMDLLERIIPSQSGDDYNVTEYTDITGEPGGEPTTTAVLSASEPATTASPGTTATASESAAVTTSVSSQTAQGASSSSSAVRTTPAVTSSVRATTTAGGAESGTAPERTSAATTSRTVRTSTTSRTADTATTTRPVRTTTTSTVPSHTATTRLSTTTSWRYTTTTAATTIWESRTTNTGRTTTTTCDSIPNTTTIDGGSGGNVTATTTDLGNETTRATTTTTRAAEVTTTTTPIFTYTTTTSVTTTVATTTSTIPDSFSRYEGFYGNGGSTYFELTGTEADPSLIGGLLEQGIAYPDTFRATEYSFYRFGNNSEDFLRAVRYDGDSRYFLSVNTEWTPETLGDVFSGMDIGKYMAFGSIYDCVSGAYLSSPERETILRLFRDNADKAAICGVSDNFLMNGYLTGSLGAPPEDDTDELLIRMEIFMPELFSDDKYYSRGYLKITRDGQLIIDMMELKYSHTIGTEAAEAFAASLRS